MNAGMPPPSSVLFQSPEHKRTPPTSGGVTAIQVDIDHFPGVSRFC